MTLFPGPGYVRAITFPPMYEGTATLRRIAALTTSPEDTARIRAGPRKGEEPRYGNTYYGVVVAEDSKRIIRADTTTCDVYPNLFANTREGIEVTLDPAPDKGTIVLLHVWPRAAKTRRARR